MVVVTGTPRRVIEILERDCNACRWVRSRRLHYRTGNDLPLLIGCPRSTMGAIRKAAIADPAQNRSVSGFA